MHAFDRQTDGQTDGQNNLIVRPRLHSMQRGKNSTCLATGSSPALLVRVGDGAAETGVLDGFDNNPLCDVMTEKLIQTTAKFIRCRRALIGRYVSIRVVDYVEPIQLKLCEVDVITA